MLNATRHCRIETDALDRTIALLHFHADFDLCRSRVAWLRRFNPDVPIYGLFGGDGADAVAARSLEREGLVQVYYDSSKRPEWNKRHTDLAVCNWFRDVGRSLSFSRVHVIQWDLIFFSSLARAYPTLPSAAVAITGLVPLKEIFHVWPWTAEQPLAADSATLLNVARDRYGFRGQPYACIGPGYSLSREFLERSSEIDLGVAGHDELRLPLVAQLLGIELVDTNFYPRWGDPAVERVFNADSQEIDVREVALNLSAPLGRRAFHPCRHSYDQDTLERLAACLGDGP